MPKIEIFPTQSYPTRPERFLDRTTLTVHGGLTILQTHDGHWMMCFHTGDIREFIGLRVRPDTLNKLTHSHYSVTVVPDNKGSLHLITKDNQGQWNISLILPTEPLPILFNQLPIKFRFITPNTT